MEKNVVENGDTHFFVCDLFIFQLLEEFDFQLAYRGKMRDVF
jgi:hypothetical protein